MSSLGLEEGAAKTQEGVTKTPLFLAARSVGKKSMDYVPEKTQGPALELQDELRWFERVKIDTPTHYLHHRNNQKLTAEGLFDETNKELREKGIEWIKRTAERCSVVAVLIATVAFAAAYTIPGGSNDKSGIPLFLNQPFFVVFTVADVLSISFCSDISGCISCNHHFTIPICRL
uniref:PGG domain-containing protein n=1 Tax=Quercus lobata TaxID=97700 RepID=A0A7N2R5G8_QUELO